MRGQFNDTSQENEAYDFTNFLYRLYPNIMGVFVIYVRKCAINDIVHDPGGGK